MKSLIVALLLTSSAALAQSMQPGLWQANTRLDLNGIPLPASEAEECISSEDAKDVKKTISKELSKKGCEITKWTLKNKKLDATLKCQSKDLEAEGSLKGTVTEKSYELTGSAEGSFKGIPSAAGLQLKGKWVRVCKN